MPIRNKESNRGAAIVAATYEPPAFPLTDDALRQLQSLITRSAMDTHSPYQQHLNKTLRMLSDAADAVNEDIEDQRRVLQEVEKRRAEKSAATGEESAMGNAERRARALLEWLEPAVEAATAQLEAATRETIDAKHAAADWSAALTAASNAVVDRATKYRQAVVAAQQKRQQREEAEAEAKRQAATEAEEDEAAGGAEDEEQAADRVRAEAARVVADALESNSKPVQEADSLCDVTPVAVFRSTYDRLRAKYEGMTAAARYAQDNDYAAFRKVLHDSKDPDKPVPHARSWFDARGNPLHLGLPKTKTHDTDGDGDVDMEDVAEDAQGDEDEDLVIEGEKRDFRCPLSMSTMVNPVTSTKCVHSFEKSAFQAYVRQNRGAVTCPVAGCEQHLTLKDVREDRGLRRKIERAARLARAEDGEQDEDNDGEVEEDGIGS